MTKRQSGILPDQEIRALFDAGALKSAQALDEDQIQPASLDLRLGQTAYRVRASFMPGTASTVREKLETYKLHEIDLREGAVLETGCVYIVPLLETLTLPDDVSASANPKSSTGRLDIFTRVMADYAVEFDKIRHGYNGELFLEVSPRTFPIVARTGSRLSQIRFRKGLALLGATELGELHKTEMLIFDDKANISDMGIA
ncbi:MAG: 2'-deoxycytidine 5'-triphosphate deaminase, partial [Pseudomonadota bacterium]